MNDFGDGAGGFDVAPLVPVSDTVSGEPPAPVKGMLRVPVSAVVGEAVGVNTTFTWHVEPSVTVPLVQVFVTGAAKSEPFVPVNVVPVSVIVTPVLFVSVTVCEELAVFCVTVPKAKDVGLMDTLPDVPRPERGTS